MNNLHAAINHRNSMKWLLLLPKRFAIIRDSKLACCLLADFIIDLSFCNTFVLNMQLQILHAIMFINLARVCILSSRNNFVYVISRNWTCKWYLTLTIYNTTTNNNNKTIDYIQGNLLDKITVQLPYDPHWTSEIRIYSKSSNLRYSYFNFRKPRKFKRLHKLFAQN